MLNPETMLYRATDMTINESKKVKLSGIVRLNWGAPFIIAFMVLLLGAVVSLIIGISSFADTLATGAFYALAIGIVLQVFCFVKYEKNKQTGAS
jgi:hypothetical protein